MKLDDVRPLYDGDTCYASVYLDVSRDTENAEHQIELRWRSALADLEAAGCDRKTLDALTEFQNAAGPSPARGLAVFAAAGQVLFAEVMPAPPVRPIARFARLPHLMPLLAQAPPAPPHLLVAADLSGGEIVSPDSPGRHTEEVRGAAWPVHRTSVGGWSQARYQRSVDHAWQQNAGELAGAVATAAAQTGAEIIILAGDVRARSLLIDQLPATVQALVVSVEAEVGADSERLRAEAEQAARQRRDQRSLQLLDGLRQGLTRAGAAQGLGQTVAALQDGRVAQLLIADDPTSDAQAWIGPGVTELALSEDELRDRGVADPVQDRLDAAIVRALAGTGAELHLIPEGADRPDGGLGAILRYADPTASSGTRTSEGG